MDLRKVEADNIMMYLHVWFDTFKKDYIETQGCKHSDWMKKYTVFMDKDVDLGYSDAKRNYFRLRGKTVTEAQAFDVIRRTDILFAQGRYNVTGNDWNDYVHCNHLSNNWLKDNMAVNDWNGWMHPDGMVGYNSITGKHPVAIDLIMEMAALLDKFPYLDMVLAVTDWNEIPEYVWNYMDDCYSDDSYENMVVSEEEYKRKNAERLEIQRKENYKGFNESIWFGVHIHDNMIELLNSENAAKRLKEYEGKYGYEDKQTYTHWYFHDKGKSPCDKTFKQKCLEVYREMYYKTPAGMLNKDIDQLMKKMGL